MKMKHLALVWTSGDFRGVEDMNRYWIPVTLALAIAVNGSLLPSLFPGAVMPDLVLVIVVIAPALTKPKGIFSDCSVCIWHNPGLAVGAVYGS